MSIHAAIHVGCKQLGLDEDDRRALYERVTGKASLKDMNAAERERVLADLRAKGFKSGSNRARKPLEGQYAKKLQALWIGAWNLGIVHNRDDKAMLAFVKRQTGIDHTRFLRHAEDANKAIEALKAWMAREGGVDWSAPGIGAPPFASLAGYRIASAQWKNLHRDMVPSRRLRMFMRFVVELTGSRQMRFMDTEADWIPVMNALGQRIRDNRRVVMTGSGSINGETGR